MPNQNLFKINSISEAHEFLGLPKPLHPNISVLDNSVLNVFKGQTDIGAVFNFYFISLKKGSVNKLFYGQQTYDFNEGMMVFSAPNQVLRGAGPGPGDDMSGWFLLIHSDFIWGTPLAKKMKRYEFFDYSVNEALFLSKEEEIIVNGIINNIKTEYTNNPDKLSKDIIISYLETFFNYADRFYQRQFLTRKKSNHVVLDRLEKLLNEYFKDSNLLKGGLPTVKFISESLNVSPNYLSGLLKSLTGQSTQNHIHEKLISRAKELLSTSELTISEVAYELGFEHPQSFSKLFKAKTNLSPLEFKSDYQ
ncbi:MAG: helix-turn-helix transcriptional regulator [Bacteroidetes bacterium]|nr:helix-turn-helix transcriptional regulator [Bacteroidota bacterium]